MLLRHVSKALKCLMLAQTNFVPLQEEGVRKVGVGGEFGVGDSEVMLQESELQNSPEMQTPSERKAGSLLLCCLMACKF